MASVAPIVDPDRFGWRFLVGDTWDPVREVFGALPFVFGTVASSLLALAIAVPVALGAAIFLSELAPRWVARPIGFMIEMLAAVPSVIFTACGACSSWHLLRERIEPALGHLPVPFFQAQRSVRICSRAVSSCRS